MSSLNVDEHVTSLPEDARLVSRCPALSARRTRRARLVVLAVAASVVATGAIAVGLPATGLAIYLAATLPFAFFS
jgi:negative regulator of sigma E activity